MITNIKDPTLRAVLKYKDHPSILEIHKCKEMDLESIEREIHKLQINKSSQSSDIPIKLIAENVDNFAELLWKNINS